MVSLPRTPPFSMITATAIFGLPLTSAKPVNQACGGVVLAVLALRPVSAVPVLPPTATPESVIARRAAGALRAVDDALHHRRCSCWSGVGSMHLARAARAGSAAARQVRAPAPSPPGRASSACRRWRPRPTIIARLQRRHPHVALAERGTGRGAGRSVDGRPGATRLVDAATAQRRSSSGAWSSKPNSLRLLRDRLAAELLDGRAAAKAVLQDFASAKSSVCGLAVRRTSRRRSSRRRTCVGDAGHVSLRVRAASSVRRRDRWSSGLIPGLQRGRGTRPP